LAREIEKGELYLAYIMSPQMVVGTLRFEWAGDGLWCDQPARAAGYLHTMAIRPTLHGHGLGERLINWAKEHVRSRNCNFLRVDCVATNGKLRDYYTRLGFRCYGEATHEGFTGALFEFVL
jgi:GNAT superfamily N-acetyltransferase